MSMGMRTFTRTGRSMLRICTGRTQGRLSKSLTLSSFFTDPEAARTRILETLSGKDALSGYSADTLSSEFKDEYFYLTEDGFVFYFQPDTVAPYAAGLLEFSIPYSELEDLLSPTL